MARISAREFILNNSSLDGVNKKNCYVSRLGRKYRSRLEIMALVLEAISLNKSTTGSLMKYAKINYKQFKRYLEFLRKIGFIDVTIQNSQISYKINDRGITFLRQYYILIEMLLGFHAKDKQLTQFLTIIRENASKKMSFNEYVYTADR